MFPAEKVAAFERLSKYLHLDSYIKLIDSDFLSFSEQHALVGMVREVQQRDRLELLFRATRDGFDAATFHRLCDQRGPTLVVARSVGGYVFGGYTDTSWDSSGRSTRGFKAFLFLLDGPGASSSVHSTLPGGYSMFCSQSWGPTFGSSYLNPDLCIDGTSASMYLGQAYSARGRDGCERRCLAESSNVELADYEVFSI